MNRFISPPGRRAFRPGSASKRSRRLLTGILGVCSAAVVLATMWGPQPFRSIPNRAVVAQTTTPDTNTPTPLTTEGGAQPADPLSWRTQLLSGNRTLAQESDPNCRERLIERLAEGVPDESISDALALLAREHASGDSALSARLVRRWADADPRRAAAWVTDLPGGDLRRAALEQVAISWANSNLQESAQWLHSLPEEPDTRGATIAFSYEATRTNPLLALEAVGQLEPSPQRDEALAYAVRQWVATDASSASQWAGAVTDSDLRQRLLAAVALAASTANGAVAADFAASQLMPGDQQDRAAVAVVQRWAQSDPGAAAAWVSQFPDNSLRLAAAEDLASIWMEEDPAAAMAWLTSLPPGSFRDAAGRGASASQPSDTTSSGSLPGGR